MQSPRFDLRVRAARSLALSLASVCGLHLLGIPAAASSFAAQDATVAAYLSHTEVGVGQSFVLNVQVSGARDIDQEPQPDLAAFARFLGRQQSQSFQMSNGVTSVSFTLQYRYQATQEGAFEIPPMTVGIDGQAFETEALTLTVSASPPSGGGAAGTPRGRGGVIDDGSGDSIAPEDFFIVAEPSRRRVLQNEPVIVEYKLFTKLEIRSYGLTSVPSTAGFWVEEIELPNSPQVQEVVRDGQRYATVVVRKVVMFPTASGTKVVEPLGVEAQARMRGRDPRDPFGGLDDFFGRGSLLSAFGRMVPISAASAAVEIEVESPPLSGRPDSFAGFVGDLEVTASADKSEVGTDDAVTLRVAVSGTGNLRAMAEPQIDVPAGFEAFPPEVSDQIRRSDRGVSGTRTYEYVLIPRAPGVYTIPSVEIGYYDLSREAYAVAATEPLSIEVSGRDVGASDLGGPDSPARSSVAALRTDIRFIRLDAPGLVRRGTTLFGHPGFWLVLALPLLVLTGALVVRRHRDRLLGDVAYARRRRASRLARKRLAQARSLVGSDEARDFYAETARSLEGFIADQLDLAEAGLIRDQARELLGDRGVTAETSAEVLACLSQCDRHRFAPPSNDADQRSAFLDRVAAAMTSLERELAR